MYHKLYPFFLFIFPYISVLMCRLDQGLMDGYSCPTCRRPLFLSSEGHVRSTTTEVENVQRIAEQLNMGLTQQRVPGNEFPVEQQNTSDAVSRYVLITWIVRSSYFYVFTVLTFDDDFN
jgi:hypothetical protein